MSKIEQNRGAGRWAFSLLAVGCVVLLLVVTTAELLHSHADGHEHSNCPLCLGAHQAAQASEPVIVDCCDQVIAQLEPCWKTTFFSDNVIIIPVTRPPPSVIPA